MPVFVTDFLKFPIHTSVLGLYKSCRGQKLRNKNFGSFENIVCSKSKRVIYRLNKGSVNGGMYIRDVIELTNSLANGHKFNGRLNPW